MTFSTGLVTATAAVINQTAAQATSNAALTGAPAPVQNQYLVCGVNSPASNSLVVPSQGVNQNPAGRTCDIIPQMMCNLHNAISGGTNPLDANTVYAGSFAGSVVQACGAGYLYRI